MAKMEQDGVGKTEVRFGIPGLGTVQYGIASKARMENNAK
jgi:hypothetical protein